VSGNYDYFRKALKNGRDLLAADMRLFLASGDRDQRGVYGELNTFLLHKDLARTGVEHLYCTYHGTHSDMAWVSAMLSALRYLLAPPDSGFDPSCAETAVP